MHSLGRIRTDIYLGSSASICYGIFRILEGVHGVLVPQSARTFSADAHRVFRIGT